MPAMTKRVNINAPVAIKTITPPIYGTCKNVIMTTGDILKCLCRRAIVEEILPDGSTIRLNMRNYYTDNGAGLFVEKEKKKHVNSEKAPEAPKSEEKKDEAPVVETSESNNEDVAEPDNGANDSTDSEPSVEAEVEEVAEVVATPPKKSSKKGNKKSANTSVDTPAVEHEDEKQNVTGDNSTESSSEEESVTE